MKIREVDKNKKQFISLLLLADEQENMIDRYIEKGTMYVLEDGNVKAECVVTDEDNGILEIKNIAVDPQNQGKGYGKALIDFLASKYADEYSVLQVGTGDSPLTIPFYEKCGFVRSHTRLTLETSLARTSPDEFGLSIQVKSREPERRHEPVCSARRYLRPRPTPIGSITPSFTSEANISRVRVRPSPSTTARYEVGCGPPTVNA